MIKRAYAMYYLQVYIISMRLCMKNDERETRTYFPELPWATVLLKRQVNY